MYLSHNKVASSYRMFYTSYFSTTSVLTISTLMIMSERTKTPKNRYLSLKTAIIANQITSAGNAGMVWVNL